MRNLLIAAAMVTSVGVCTGAFAADYTSSSPKTTAYLNFGFGGSGKHSDILSSLHYGLRMDQNNPYASQLGGQPSRPAFMQADFNLRDGFSGAMMNGVRFASHVNSFDEDGGETSYSVMDWGLLALGAAGLGVGIAEVLKTKDSPAPQSTVVVQGPNGPVTVLLNTATGTVSQVLNAAGVPIDLSTVTGPLLTSVCALGKVPGICLTEDRRYQNAAYQAERDIQREIWLDSGTGQMGDLNAVR